MAWTAPMTFTANSALTSAQLNTHLRDNMFQTEVAKVTAIDNYLVCDAPNSIAQRSPSAARVDADESTTSTNYLDLDTVGPSVTVATGTTALCWLRVNIYNANTNSAGGMSFAISGTQPDGSDGTAIDAQDSFQAVTDGVTSGSGNTVMHAVLIKTLTAGTNTFTSKYKAGSGTAHFRNRVIAIMGY